jgi:tRNA-Thr(GGU) m(6)t(6)A37 methyltransferase TsaA
MTTKSPDYELHPIGHVRRSPQSVHLEIAEPFRPGLKQLEHFSHVIVLWWADQHDNAEDRSTMQCYPPYAPSKLTGVFACRAEYRPNPIGITTCKISDLDEEHGVLGVHNIDALNGTPILDLKGYSRSATASRRRASQSGRKVGGNGCPMRGWDWSTEQVRRTHHCRGGSRGSSSERPCSFEGPALLVGR